MHRFLRAIGFSNITSRQELEPVLGKIMNDPDKKKRIKLSERNTYTEYAMEFGSQIGIAIRGEYDEKGFFYMSHYFPYCESRLITSEEDVYVNKRVDTNAFTGMCDDFRLGISMIFYLQNAVDYLSLHASDNTPLKASLTLSGLCLQGVILLGVHRDIYAKQQQHTHFERKQKLIAKAKNGDRKAMDDLALADMDLAARIRNRIQHEDLYSIVENSLVPYGSESDHYSILGTIVNWCTTKNTYTNEEVYQILLNCNNIHINICINKRDLLGEPMIGRRFKGVMWMQGHADFKKIN